MDDDVIIKFKNTYFSEKMKNKTLYSDNNDDMNYIIRKAYADMMPRTFRKKCKEAKINQENKDKVLEWLKCELIKYINDKTINFDEWHKEICCCFLRKFYYDVLEEKYKEIHFGKAQKIVNMSMKYLYCFEDTDEKLFVDCHMPLDTVILNWFYKEVHSVDKKHRKVWSNLDYGSAEEIGSYMWIQNEIKKHISKKKNGKTVLENEFEIYAEWKNK